MAMTLNRIANSLRGLAQVIREHGTCAAGALEVLASDIDARLSAQAPVRVSDEDVERALQAHREHLATSWDCDIPSAQFMAMHEALESFAARLSQGATTESDLHVLMDRNAWRAAMIGLCVPLYEADVATPELAAEHLRKRLSQGAQD